MRITKKGRFSVQLCRYFLRLCDIAFVIINSLGADSSFWSFGDGNFAIQTNPTHSYAAVGTYLVTLVAFNTIDSCGDEISKVYQVINVGIEEVTQNQSLQVYPNPAMDHLVVEYKFEGTGDVHLSIINVLGVEIHSELVENSSSFQKTIDLDGWAKGTYLLKVSRDDVEMMKKIIVE